MSLALTRLGLALRGYDPNQPRVPAGSSEGGRWSDGGGGGAIRLPSDLPTGFVQLGPDQQPSINLREEEAKGGHTLREHVGKIDEFLLNTVRRDRVRTFLFTRARIGKGSFTNENGATFLVNRTIDENIDEIQGKLKNEDDFAVQHRFGYVTGREAFRPDADADPYIQQTYEVRVVIRPDSSRQRGYGIVTAFPINRDPNRK